MDSELMEAARLINYTQRILVLTHQVPDGDAIGSAVAMRSHLLSLKKTVVVGCIDVVPRRFSFLEGSEDFVSGADLQNLVSNQQETPDTVKLIITVDVPALGQLGPVFCDNRWFFESRPLINIDHHVTNTNFGTVNILRPDFSSAAEVVYELIESMGAIIESSAATSLLAGIVSDTGRFSTANVTSRTMTTGAKLLDAGADIIKINQRLSPAESIQIARLRAQLVSELKTTKDDNIAWIAIHKKDRLGSSSTEETMSDLASYLRSLQEVRIGVVFFERGNGSVKVSLRGRPGINVLSVAKRFGGGGHLEAAGFIMENSSLFEAESRVVSELKKLSLPGS